MNRRTFVVGAASVPLAWEFAPAAAPADQGASFNAYTVRQMARDLAQKPFKAGDITLPDSLRDLSYDRYRMIRFIPERALWRGENLPFEAQFFHRGFFFSNRVDIYEVVDGTARPIIYSPGLFNFGDVSPPPSGVDLGFAGFRLHAPMNRQNYYDEVGVFLGASYFRAVAKNQIYGLSARGLAINTAAAKGEEFPAFKAFWIEKPQPKTTSIVVHALLDSDSAAASYRFTIRPGDATIYDVEMNLYPRVEIDQSGIAPLTSMFFFDANNRAQVDDFRPAVHDSDGLAMRNGRGEELWRPLSNPKDLQISTFNDTNPRGFGLVQRQRDFHAYEDLESRFEKRPSLWIEPIGDWGEGSIQLIEIPTKEEIHDNVVGFWRPREALRPKGEYAFTYRLYWGWNKPAPSSLAEIISTRCGAGPDNTRLFVLDVAGERLKNLRASEIRAVVSADKGKIKNIVSQPNPETGGWRISFQLAPEKVPAVELRAQLLSNEEPLSEVWIYRWTT